ncbi:MAG: PEP-CTERM sorting domain-containing protein [Reyranella sp.]
MTIHRTHALARIGLTAFSLLAVSPYASAQFISGPLDPDYNTTFQGASAHTFADLGFSVGNGASQLHVSTGTWTDPSGLIFGTIVPAAAHIAGNGTTVNKMTYGYTQPSLVPNPGDARDYSWIQNNASNLSTNPTLDQPWVGNIFDLGGQANKAVVFPIVDHGPLPQEVVEYTVYLGDNPLSTNLADWHLAKLTEVYMQGWEADGTSLADGFTTVWTLADPAASFRYVSVAGVGSQALLPYSGNEDEIDAVAGLTVNGGGVGPVPEPSTYALMLAGLGLAAFVARRRRGVETRSPALAA